VLRVDLARSRSTAAPDRIIVSALPLDWQSLPVVAHAIGVNVSFEPGRNEGVILVRRNADSIPCTLVEAIAPDAKTVDVTITFFERGRYSGETRCTFALEGTAKPPVPAIDTRTDTAILEPGIAVPDLTVIVRNLQPERPGLLYWDLRLAERYQSAGIPNLPRELSGKHDLEADPQPWVPRIWSAPTCLPAASFSRWRTERQAVHRSDRENHVRTWGGAHGSDDTKRALGHGEKRCHRDAQRQRGGM
jgi:hypothetical protein